MDLFEESAFIRIMKGTFNTYHHIDGMVRNGCQLLCIVMYEADTGMLMLFPGEIQVLLVQINTNNCPRFISHVDIVTIQAISTTNLKQIHPLQVAYIGKTMFYQVVLPLFQRFHLLHIEGIVKHMRFAESICQYFIYGPVVVSEGS